MPLRSMSASAHWQPFCITTVRFCFLLSGYYCSCCSVTKSCRTLCDPMDRSTPGSPVLHISQSLLKFICIELVTPSNHVILCHSLLLLPSIFPSIRVFSNESALCVWWSKYWCFSISPLKEYSRLTSFRIEGFDLLAVQGTLKSLLQDYNSKASLLQCSAFIMFQYSHPYMNDYKKTHSFD